MEAVGIELDSLFEAVLSHYAQAGVALGLPARRHGSGLISLQHLPSFAAIQAIARGCS
jgi:hypothetical protein